VTTDEPAQQPTPHQVRIFPWALRRILSFPVFLAAVLSAGAMAVTVWEKAPIPGGKLFVEGDTWWHLTVGELILATHTWPTHDIYSLTAYGVPWIAYEWLGEVVMALAHRLAGLQGLAGLLVLLAIIYALLVYFYAWLVSRHHLASACAAGLLLPVGAASFTLRPQIIGYIFLLITLICLEGYRQGKRRALWVLPGLFLLWANIHGSFPLGFFVLGLYWLSGLVSFRSGALVAERLDPVRRRHVLWIALWCLLATMITPYGTRLAAYPLEYMSEQPVNLGLTIEWLPLDFLQPYAQMFLLILLIVLAGQVAAPVTYRLDTLVLVLLMIGESCRHARFLIVFAAVIAPVLATLFARWLPPYQPEKDHPFLNALLIAAILWGMVAFFPSRSKFDQALAETFPVGAVQYLRQHPSSDVRMFNDGLWGGYLIWAMGPQRRVFIDGRFDIYEYRGVLIDYYNVVTLHDNPEVIFSKYKVDSALVPLGPAIEVYMASSPHWKQVYTDHVSVIFARQEANDAAKK